MRFRAFGVAGLLSLVLGCSDLKPDSISVGVAGRQVKGRYNGFNIKEFICLGRVQGNKKINSELDGYLRADYNNGGIDASHPVFCGDVGGDFVSLGCGLNYSPFSKYWGFELGAEVFRADINMTGGLGDLRIKTPDTIYGFGGSVGIFGNLPIDDNFSLTVSGGYNFTDNFSKEAWADFDGWHGFIGVKIRIPNR